MQKNKTKTGENKIKTSKNKKIIIHFAFNEM